MQRRDRYFPNKVKLVDLIESTLAEDKANRIKGTISYWDDEKGRGYISPEKDSDKSFYGNGQYYFTYITLTDAKYSPKVGDVVMFRKRKIGDYTVAEIMEVVL